MRMRFKPYARAELLAADFHIHDPFHLQGQWHAQFPRPQQPLVLELGCGKGGFISQLAAAHPENNYLGIDITDKVLILAKRKIEAAYAAAGRPIDNVRIMSADIERIRSIMTPDDTVSRIYINFCNPWSKNAGSNKHRLTHPRQLIQYRDFLVDGGEIYFKTDDDDLFRDSLGYFPAAGYEITWQTYDLHDHEPAWNIRTEHEGMFTEMGIKIKALIARKLPGDGSVTWVEPKRRGAAGEDEGAEEEPSSASVPARRINVGREGSAHAVWLYLLSDRSLFSDLLLPGVVRRGGLCRRHPGQAGQPRLSERAGLPHLWLWDAGPALCPDPPAGQQPAFVRGRGHHPQRHRAGRRVAFVRALPHPLVGLHRPAVQHRRLHLPGIFPLLGAGLGPLS